MTRPSRAAIEVALSALRTKARELSNMARWQQVSAAQCPWMPDAPKWKRRAKRDAAKAGALAEMIAWMEGRQDG